MKDSLNYLYTIFMVNDEGTLVDIVPHILYSLTCFNMYPRNFLVFIPFWHLVFTIPL